MIDFYALFKLVIFPSAARLFNIAFEIAFDDHLANFLKFVAGPTHQVAHGNWRVFFGGQKGGDEDNVADVAAGYFSFLARKARSMSSALGAWTGKVRRQISKRSGSSGKGKSTMKWMRRTTPHPYFS